MRAQLQDLLPEFRISSFVLNEAAQQAQLLAHVLLSQPLQIGHRVVNRIVVANAAVTLGAFWQPVAIAMATAAVWPLQVERAFTKGTAPAPACAKNRAALARLGARALAIGLAGFASTLLSMVLAPAMLSGLIMSDIYWHEASDQIIPHIVRLPRFLEEGGWTMLGLIIGALCASSAHWLLAGQESQS